MVRKMMTCVIVLVLLIGSATGAQAATHTIYDGNISNTYVTYFRDILAGVPLKDNYVCFRSGQYEYIMVTGDLNYDGDTFDLDGNGTAYTFSTASSGYNSTYTYYVEEITAFSLNVGNAIIYSDLGQFPQLIERGAQYDILTAVLCTVLMLSIVINRIFWKR